MCPCEDVDEWGWINVGGDVRLCEVGAIMAVECFVFCLVLSFLT